MITIDLVETGTINSGNVVAGIRLSAANAGWPLIKMKMVVMGGVVVGPSTTLKFWQAARWIFITERPFESLLPQSFLMLISRPLAIVAAMFLARINLRGQSPLTQQCTAAGAALGFDLSDRQLQSCRQRIYSS